LRQLKETRVGQRTDGRDKRVSQANTNSTLHSFVFIKKAIEGRIDDHGAGAGPHPNAATSSAFGGTESRGKLAPPLASGRGRQAEPDVGQGSDPT
jgi:hypothetical protein